MGVVLKEPGQVFGRRFDPSNVAVMADAHQSEAKLVQEKLCLVHLVQLFQRHTHAVWDARGKTSAAGLIPRRQPKLFGKLANLTLLQFGFH